MSSKAVQSESRREPSAPVPVTIEVIRVIEDVLDVTSHGQKTVGHWIDLLIDSSFTEGDRLGRVTIDLAEFSKAFCPSKSDQGAS